MVRRKIDNAIRQSPEIEIVYVARGELTPDPKNSKAATEEELASIMRSIVEFGLVDPLITRTGKPLVGGHQRLQAIDRLLAGPFTYKGKGGEKVVVQWQLPKRGIPVVRVDHLSDEQARLLNIALTKNTVDHEPDQLAQLLKSLTEGEVALDLYELTATGFSAAELTDYIDIASETPDPDGEGTMPTPSQQAPKITLDFTSKEARDVVKAAIAAQTRGEEPSGEVLARMLGVKVRKKRAA